MHRNTSQYAHSPPHICDMYAYIYMYMYKRERIVLPHLCDMIAYIYMYMYKRENCTAYIYIFLRAYRERERKNNIILHDIHTIQLQ